MGFSLFRFRWGRGLRPGSFPSAHSFAKLSTRRAISSTPNRQRKILAGIAGVAGGLVYCYMNNAAEARAGHVYIVGDVGGTKSRIRMFLSEIEIDDEKLLASKTYPSQEYGSLTTILQEFQEENKDVLATYGTAKACIMAVAGPVELNQVYMPNTGWRLSGEAMAQVLNIPKVLLLNDFVAVGYGILGLKKGDYHVIQDKPCNAKGPIVVYGPGTGLGQAYLTWSKDEYQVWPSEGGHSDWAPRTNQEMRLWHFLKSRIRHRMLKEGRKSHEVDHVSRERVISGSGIPDVYDFFRGEYPEYVDPKIEEQMQTMEKSAVVSINGGKNTNFVCRRAMEQWAQSFGQAVGDLALMYMPTGGIYIAGGVTPKNLDVLRETDFTKWVNSKGRLSKTMESIPVFVVKEQVPIGVVGARVVARRVLKEMYPKEDIHSESKPRNRIESDMALLLNNTE